MLVFVVVFFFQAEDGIRDGHVTGVQTCALPIYNFRQPVQLTLNRRLPAMHLPFVASPVVDERSEERRVGKECRKGREEVEEKKKQGNVVIEIVDARNSNSAKNTLLRE